MKVEVLYFDGCPAWQFTWDRLDEALRLAGMPDARLSPVRLASDAEAAALGFTGSPTIRVDGEDLFPGAPALGVLARRFYATPDGVSGTPTVGQMVTALAEWRRSTR
jgi:hypothetical protein